MGFCILGGKENYLRKLLSDTLTSLGKTIGMGASPDEYAEDIQEIYDERYEAGKQAYHAATHVFSITSGTTISTLSWNTGKGSKLIGASVTGVNNLRFYSWQENYNAYAPGGVACNCNNGNIVVSFSGHPTRETGTGSGDRTNVTITVTYWYYD